MKFLFTIPWIDEADGILSTAVGVVSAGSREEAWGILDKLCTSDLLPLNFLIGRRAYDEDVETLQDYGIRVGEYRLIPVDEVEELNVERVLAGSIEEPDDAWLPLPKKPTSVSEP